MEVEGSLKEQVRLLKSSFTDDVISAILKENPEFKKYMDYQERAESESINDVSDAVNREINKDQAKTNDTSSPKKAKIPTKLNGITIQKVNKNAPTSNNNPAFVDLTSEKDTDDAFLNKNNVTIKKSEKTKRYISVRSWYDGSTYECIKCTLVLFQYRAFRPHLQKHHQLSPEKIIDLSAKAKKERDSKKYKCLICQEDIFHDKNDIMFHLEKNHKMSLKNYELNYQQYKENVSQNKERLNGLSSKTGISITKSTNKSNINESTIRDAAEMKRNVDQGNIRENKETENTKLKNNQESSFDKEEKTFSDKKKAKYEDTRPINQGNPDLNKEKDRKNNTDELKQQVKDMLKENKEGENQSFKRKLSQNEISDRKDAFSTHKKMKYEDITESAIGDTKFDGGNKSKSDKIGKEKEEVKKSSGKEINYVVALLKDNYSNDSSKRESILGDKLPKEKPGKDENFKDKNAQHNSAKNTKDSSNHGNSAKKDTSQDQKSKTSQKPFQKYGQNYKESINYSAIFNEPHFETSRSWYDGVEYQCSFCNTIFFEIVNFRLHIRKNHDIHKEILNDIADDAKQARENSEYFCLICEARVMYTKDDIRIHLKTKHSLSLKQYEEIDFTDEAKVEALKKSNDSTSSTDSKPDQPTAIAEKKWFDERAIICSFCDDEFLKVDAYMDHIAQVHPEKKDTVTKKSIQVSQQYKCKMQSCSSRIKRHKRNISDHLRKVHSLALEDYEKLHEQVVTDKETSSVSFETIFESLEPNGQQFQGDDNEIDYSYDQEYSYDYEYEMEDSYEFDEEYFTKKYFCPIQSCEQIMYQEDIESGSALDHFKFEHYLTVEEIADNLAHLEDIIDNNDESAERINYKCPIKDCTFTIHQAIANTSALTMHLGFQHQMSHDEVLLNIFYFANIVKREVFKEEECKDYEEEEEEEERDINHNKILKQSVVERKRYIRGIEMTRKESIFHCKVCKSDGMSEGAADLHLRIHHEVSPDQIKINLGLILL